MNSPIRRWLFVVFVASSYMAIASMTATCLAEEPPEQRLLIELNDKDALYDFASQVIREVSGCQKEEPKSAIAS